MAKKKSEPKIERNIKGVEGLHAETVEQPICQTLEQNYMPYAMSVIVSRAITLKWTCTERFTGAPIDYIQLQSQSLCGNHTISAPKCPRQYG